ncbi:MAG TPA: DNA integrity scanning diadenylate cyclase DisA [Acidimicrobiia bacterium]|nr:DNA integrity scanning diadenylate cyclase DisA [Acidimicrobiia bacterium]
MGGPSITETLERLAPGTPMRRALERIIQQGKGGLVVLGDGSKVAEVSSGGFALQGATFTPARLAELSKMDGGVILDDAWANITEAAVHFIPDGSIPTDETGARHRTAERMAAQTGKPVVAVSEGRKVATLFHEGQKIELASPTEVSAHVNQELQSLDRLRSRLDEAEAKLTRLEVAGISTYRSAVTVLQRAELVERVGRLVEARTLTMGDGGQIVYLQLNDLLSGVELTKRNVLRDYVKPLRATTVSRALERLTELQGQDLEDPGRVGKEVGFPDLDDLADPRGFRLLSQVGRLPDPVRDDIIKHFGSQARLLHATQGEMIEVEGVGEARAGQLRAYFDRLLSTVHEWEPVFD